MGGTGGHALGRWVFMYGALAFTTCPSLFLSMMSLALRSGGNAILKLNGTKTVFGSRKFLLTGSYQGIIPSAKRNPGYFRQ